MTLTFTPHKTQSLPRCILGEIFFLPLMAGLANSHRRPSEVRHLGNGNRRELNQKAWLALL